MKKFILKAEKKLLDDFTIQVTLMPDDILITNYLNTSKNYLHDEATDENINNFIIEMTPYMFNTFKNMENVPDFIRNQFEL